MPEHFGPFGDREMELSIKHVVVEAHPESMIIGHIITHACHGKRQQGVDRGDV